MSAHLHLAESAEPIVQGSTVKALCGTEVLHAVAIHLGEDGAIVGGCRKCRAESWSEAITHSYLYAIQNAQEAKLEGNDAY